MKITYINLTDGFRPDMVPGQEAQRYIRADSRAFDAKRYGDILRDLPDDFYMQLASGHEVVIREFPSSGRSRLPDHIVTWIRFALDRLWFGRESAYNINGNDSTNYFQVMFNNLPQVVLLRLVLLKPFVKCKEINLKGVVNDNEKDFRDGTIDRFRGGL